MAHPDLDPDLAELHIGEAPTAPEADPAAEARRLQRLADGVQGIKGGGGFAVGERLLLLVGGVLAPLGLVIVYLGWAGASRTPNLYEQIPYAISGGFLGLGLCFLGSFMYFVHWITQLVKEHRTQSAAIIEAITRLESSVSAAVARSTPPPPASNGSRGRIARAAAPVADEALLVATERGSMAHRPDCVVVAGKVGVRPVRRADALAPCKLCDPYFEPATN